ncbi:hypothetical protein SAMN04488023_1433, partial [Pedobacter rhizosphaerae]
TDVIWTLDNRQTFHFHTSIFHMKEEWMMDLAILYLNHQAIQTIADHVI